MPIAKYKVSEASKYQGVVAVLVDMQNWYVFKIPSGIKEALIQAQIEVIRECARKDIPLVIIEYEGDGETIDALKTEIALVPRKKTIIKSYDDGFSSISLFEALQTYKAKTLLLMGINASYCVLATAQSAVRLGFKVVTGESLIADSEAPDKEDAQKSRQWYLKNGSFHFKESDLETVLKDARSS